MSTTQEIVKTLEQELMVTVRIYLPIDADNRIRTISKKRGIPRKQLLTQVLEEFSRVEA